jgi:hypothetical protein
MGEEEREIRPARPGVLGPACVLVPRRASSAGCLDVDDLRLRDALSSKLSELPITQQETWSEPTHVAPAQCHDPRTPSSTPLIYDVFSSTALFATTMLLSMPTRTLTARNAAAPALLTGREHNCKLCGLL